MSTGSAQVGAVLFASMKLAPVPSHPRIRNWATFDPPLRDRAAGASCLRTVSCRACSAVLGSTDDPVDALLIAVRHRLRVRRDARARRVAVRAASR